MPIPHTGRRASLIAASLVTPRESATVQLAFLAPQKPEALGDLPPARLPEAPAAARSGPTATDAVVVEMGRKEAGPAASKARTGVRAALTLP